MSPSLVHFYVTTYIEPATCDDGYPEYDYTFEVDKEGKRKKERSTKKIGKDKKDDPAKDAEKKYDQAEKKYNEQH